MKSAMSFETIRYETEGPLAWITLDRPAKLNAISKGMVAELNSAMDLALHDERIRVILVKGEGRAFSAGFDLETDPDSALTPEQELKALKLELNNDFDLIPSLRYDAFKGFTYIPAKIVGGYTERKMYIIHLAIPVFVNLTDNHKTPLALKILRHHQVSFSSIFSEKMDSCLCGGNV